MLPTDSGHHGSDYSPLYGSRCLRPIRVSRFLIPREAKCLIRLDVDCVSLALKSGIEALNQSVRAIRSALGDVEICETSTFDPPVLPTFTYDPNGTKDIR